MVSWFVFLLLSIFIPVVAHFVFSCVITHYAYDVVVQLSLTFASNLLYFFLFMGEVAYNVWWYSLGSEQVLFAMASRVVVGDVVAYTLKLTSDIR